MEGGREGGEKRQSVSQAVTLSLLVRPIVIAPTTILDRRQESRGVRGGEGGEGARKITAEECTCTGCLNAI